MSDTVAVILRHLTYHGSRPILTHSVGPLFDITRLTSLTRLDVRSNSLSGQSSLQADQHSQIEVRLISCPGPFPATFRYLTKLTSLYLSSNTFTGPFPSEPAPPALRSCYIMPNTVNPCPSAIDLAHPESIVSACHVSCGKSAQNDNHAGTTKAAGIPVSPLPGEAGQASQAAGQGSLPPTGPPLGQPGGAGGLAAPPVVLSQPPSPGQPMGGSGTGGGNMNASPVGRLNEQGLPIAVNARVNNARRSFGGDKGEGGLVGLYHHYNVCPFLFVALIGCLDLW